MPSAPAAYDLTGEMRPGLPMPGDDGRSLDPSVCPFFRSEVYGVLVAPAPEPDDANCCVAIGAPRQQSARQQELVCLRPTHADCPRYLRGALAVEKSAAVKTARLPRATLLALLILLLSAGISFGFVLRRGGIDLPAAQGGPTPTALAGIGTAAPLATATTTSGSTTDATAAPAPTLAPQSTPTPAATGTPVPTPTPAPTPAPTAAPTATPRATPTSDRYKLLKPCPNRKACWVYTIRAGDNLFSIANYFGVPLRTIYAWNPQYPAARLRAGDPVRMPPPTR